MRTPVAIFFLLLLVFVVSWHFLAAKSSTGLIPRPMAVAHALVENCSQLTLAALSTAKHACVGLCISILLAIAVIVTTARFPNFESAIYPFIVMLKATPALAFVPLIMTIAGSGLFGKAIIAAVISFLPIAMSSLSGLHDVPAQLKMLKRTWQPTNLRYFTTITWPYALHGFCLGLEMAAPLAIVGSIVGDFVLGGKDTGLGSFILASNSQALMANVAAGGVTATLLGVLLFFLAHGCLLFTRRHFHLAA
jgi:ABC-type nitrate/sulfonate/bicarbonate transport system permease component